MMSIQSLGSERKNTAGRFILPVRTLGIFLICLLLFFNGTSAENILIFDRQAIEAGQWWRLLTGQLIHVGLDHIFWDLTGFLMLAAMIEQKGRIYFWSMMAVAFIPIGLFVYFAMPDLQYYAGLSGGLNALLFVTTYDMWKRDGGWLGPVILIGAAIKILVELIIQASLFTNPTLPPVPEVHAIGYVCGILWICYTCFQDAACDKDIKESRE